MGVGCWGLGLVEDFFFLKYFVMKLCDLVFFGLVMILLFMFSLQPDNL